MSEKDVMRISNRDSTTTSTCILRDYPENRYYDWSRQLPNHPAFLTNAEYVFGVWPEILHSVSPARKLCVDQSSWLPTPSSSNTLAFADGTNPSIVSMRRLQQFAPSDYQTLLQAAPTTAYVATACMTNSQCTWPEATPPAKPVVVLTVLLLLDDDFHVLQQVTISLERNAKWGKQPPGKRMVDNRYERSIPALDDARLFVHDQQLWISYREGPVFGYEAQVLNPVHLELVANSATTTTALDVWIQASETTSFCCGRNMALMQDVEAATSPVPLRALTWVDPVTVETVDITPLIQRPVNNKPRGPQRRDLRQQERRVIPRNTTTGSMVSPLPELVNGSRQGLSQPLQHLHRRLGSSSKKKSHIHGTNAFMVHLADRHEYLGIGHFHRPADRAPNPYARFGHHYTHCFFTISDQPPYILTNLSPEFLLPPAAGTHGSQDAEMIQFLSGLEVVDNDTSSSKEQTVIIAYGINDCEAAVTTMPWSAVASMLRPMNTAKDASSPRQVVDIMASLLPI